MSRCRPSSAHEADRQAVLYEEQIGRAQPEHDDRVPVDAIAKPAPSRQRHVLPYGQRVDVAHAATIEIARRRVVHGMGASPKIVRRERQHPDRASDPVVGGTTMEEGAMAAIMLDHEKPHQKARGRHREQ
jgi:hypothetical protein